jgi:phosphocarrier protein
MATKAPKDTMLYFRAHGEDAEESVDALVALVARDFDETSGVSGEPAHAGAT